MKEYGGSRRTNRLHYDLEHNYASFTIPGSHAIQNLKYLFPDRIDNPDNAMIPETQFTVSKSLS